MSEINWRTSSACNNGTCIEVTRDDDRVLVRDSKLDTSPILRFPIGSWWSFIAALKTSQLGTWSGPILLTACGDGQWLMWHEHTPNVTLTFDQSEIDAFTTGVHGGEFDPDVLAKHTPASAPASTKSSRG